MSVEHFTLDSNILVYSVDTLAGLRHEIAQEIVDASIGNNCSMALQALSEFFSVTTRKGRLSASVASEHVVDWLRVFPCVATTEDAVGFALRAATRRQASYWDALLVSTMGQAGCAVMLSEDMGDGMALSGVRIVNPFGAAGMTGAARRVLQG